MAKTLGRNTEPKRSGQVPDVEAACGRRGLSWPLTSTRSQLPRPRHTLLLAALGTSRSLQPRRPTLAKLSLGMSPLTLGSTRRGVLRLMKDFMTLLREAEVGVMSIWFLCTVCRKVRRGRTTCRRGPGSGPPAGRRH